MNLENMLIGTFLILSGFMIIICGIVLIIGGYQEVIK